MTKYFIPFFVLIAYTLSAQADSTEDFSESRYTGRDIESTKRYRAALRLELNTSFGVASTDVTSASMFTFYNQSFLTNQVKQELLQDLNGKVGFGSILSWDVGFYYDYRKRGHALSDAFGFSLFQRGYTGVSAPKKSFELALLGNQPFAGENVNLDETNYEHWFYSGLRYQFNLKPKDNLIQTGISVIFAHEHTRYNFSQLQLYTAPNGAYLDVDATYELEEYSTNFLYGLAGMGLALDATYKYQRKRHLLTAKVEDVGFAYFTRGINAFADTSFRFEGVEVPNIFDVKDSLINAQTDELESELWFKTSDNRLSLLPFSASVEYGWELTNTRFKQLTGRAKYLNLFGYRPRFGFAALYELAEDHSLEVELAYGGFNAGTLGLRYEGMLSANWFVALAIDNLPGVVLPAWGNGAIARLGIKYWIM